MFFLRKVAIVAIAVVTMSLAVNAQEQGDMAVGANLVLGYNSDFTDFGVGGKFLYNVSDAIRLEGAVTFFLPKDYFGVKLSFWDLSVNGHYLLPVSDKFTLYPLVGLGIQGWKLKVSESGISVSDTGSDLCFNLGGGFDYKLTDQLFLNCELKYRIVEDWNRLVISAGITYKF